jgi:hypothetical protein
MGLVSGLKVLWTWFNPPLPLILGMECPCSVIPDSLNICITTNVVISTTPLLMWTVSLHKWIVFKMTSTKCQPTSHSFVTPSNISWHAFRSPPGPYPPFRSLPSWHLLWMPIILSHQRPHPLFATTFPGENWQQFSPFSSFCQSNRTYSVSVVDWIFQSSSPRVRHQLPPQHLLPHPRVRHTTLDPPAPSQPVDLTLLDDGQRFRVVQRRRPEWRFCQLWRSWRRVWDET